MIEKILLADSGTGQAEQMLRALMELPAIKPAAITVLHVVPRQVSSEEMQRKREEGAKTLAKAVEALHLDPQQTARVTTMLQEGEPKDEVCRIAEAIDTDLIIMGSRGLKRLVSILENSVSQYVFQLSPRPMLLIRDDIFVKQINRVMVALNPSGSSKTALDLAFGMMRDVKGGKVILVHVNPDFKDRDEVLGAAAEKDVLLAPAVAEAKRRGVAYQCVVSAGKPGNQICQIADDTNADLLILGSPDRRPSVAKSLPDLDRLLGTSTSDYVRVNAPCPVLFVRQQEG
jgi:nucleotide-binding universal stress UspA family protein